jgi:O-antigen ligase
MSLFKPSHRSDSPVRPRPLPRAIALEERNVAVEDRNGLEHGNVLIEEARQPVSIEATPRAAAPMEAVALRCTLVFLFFRISFLHEFITSKLRIDLHILLLLGVASLLTALMTGKLMVALRTRATIFWMLFALCLCAATVFSTWRGGSFPLTLDYLRTALPLLLLIPAVTSTSEDLVKIVKTIGWAGIATIALGFSNKVLVQGRMMLANAPSIGDSNDYASYLVFVFPFVVYLLFAENRAVVRKLLGFVVIPAGLYQILSTGSRGGLVGVLATVLAILLMGKAKAKAIILIGAPVLALLALPFVPSQSLQRFESLFVGSAGDKTAKESSEARQRLLYQSILLTLSHPLVGVGPGQFMENESVAAKSSGQRGMWHETHNTYTQVSSECGIPALVFFIAALATTFASLWRLKKNSNPLLATIAQFVLISMFGFAVCSFFLSHAYDFPLLISCGLSMAITRLLPASDTTSGHSSRAQQASWK